MTQQPPEVLKPRKNKVVETEAKEKDEAVKKGGGGHKRHGGKSGHFNHSAYTSLIRNFKREEDDFGAFLGTIAK